MQFKRYNKTLHMKPAKHMWKYVEVNKTQWVGNGSPPAGSSKNSHREKVIINLSTARAKKERCCRSKQNYTV